MSGSDYNRGTVLHGIFSIHAYDDGLRGQVISPGTPRMGF